MTQETKLGLFVLLGIVGLAISIIMLGDFQFQRRYYINILFRDIAGLPDKAKVKIAGVEVGNVKDISLEGNMAKVKVGLKKSIKLHNDARASIVATGLIGSKYLELTIGSKEAPLLKDGDTIRGVDPISFDKIIEDVMEQINILVDTFKGPEGKSIGKNLALTLDNLRKVSDSLRVALHEQETKLAEMVDNLHSFSQNMSDITGDNKENIKATIEEIRLTASRLNGVLEKIEKGDGTLGKLMTDDEMGNDLKETFKDLMETTKQAKKALKRFNLIETYWDYSLRYDGRYDIFRHDAGLRIYPKQDKYYYVGVSNAGDIPEGVDEPEDNNTFNVLIGKHIGPVEAYAGVVRSKGGLGVKAKPFWKWEPLRRVEITAEVHDFFRMVPVRRPKVNIGGRVEITDWAYVGAQLEDAYYLSNINSYMNVKFKDDDIAYILGLIGLAR